MLSEHVSEICADYLREQLDIEFMEMVDTKYLHW